MIRTSSAAATLLLAATLPGCAVVAVADAAVSVGAAAVSAGATVVKVGVKTVDAAVDVLVPDDEGGEQGGGEPREDPRPER